MTCNKSLQTGNTESAALKYPAERAAPTTNEDLIFCFAGEDRSEGTFINLSQVRLIDQIHKGHCRVVFSDTHALELSGKGADQFVRYLYERAMALDGTPARGHSSGDTDNEHGESRKRLPALRASGR